jgi:NAD(P)-dependent dehydrogenase (short-subunit alcohol dehydrogenase family)
MTRLEGTVLVTGGTGALGTAVVGELLIAGARVVSTWIAPEQRDRIEEELGSHDLLELLEADVSTDDGAEAAVQAARREPPLAAVANLVGGYAGGLVHEAPPDLMQRMLDLNLLTAYRTIRAALPPMLEQGGGSIVCVGAKGAVQPFKGSPAYNVAKTAVVGLVRAVAVDYRGDGVRANAVLPSVIDTPANREQMPDADHSKWVPPVQIARVIRFLCGPDSAPTSGAAIPVYGRSG